MTRKVHPLLIGVLLVSLILLSACGQRPVQSADLPVTMPPTRETPLALPSLTATSTAIPPTSTITVPPTQLELQPSATHTLEPHPTASHLIPDSEVVFSATAADFDVQDYLDTAGGFLAGYRQYLMVSKWTSGADVVSMVAIENSVNPRLLLALLEFQSGCIFDPLTPDDPLQYSIGALDARRADLYGQLVWATHELLVGYYSHLDGTLTEFSSTDGKIFAADPGLNPGTVALHYLFSRLYTGAELEAIMNPVSGFPALYQQMFGDPWSRAAVVEPLLPDGLAQPELAFPFPKGKLWALTGGPHPAFEQNGPWASLDFAPAADISGCITSDEWVLAMADGIVVRSKYGAVIQDLDGDGFEQTGWVIMYLHIDDRDRVAEGTLLQAGDPIGHPSCIGGISTGTHVHIARKYNGVWMAAGGAVPFTVDGWQAHNGDLEYLGTLTKDDQTITAHQYGSQVSHIFLEPDDQ